MKKVLWLVITVMAITLGLISFYGVEVTATIERDGDNNRCPLSSPIFVKVENNTFSTIRDVTFDLEMFKGGRSQNVLTGSLNRVFDIVIEPFSSEAGCFSDSYIKSIIEPNPIDFATATSKEAASSSLESIKNFREFEGTHAVYISNIEVSYLK
ncbi:TPA: hypothetical protein ACN359_004477 [Vibrio parahaemolyticus]|uniref:hypothetical protein n=1 Tax=Vibrio diabolicus TaxID=50719 RepID=UPI001428890E|nr:hypothetical protein [Vibrio diabolicus]EIO3965149.1 hypothetical protein [Vibrio parahaemolyticus]EIO3987930.1 hypothetical protein [Vibrio parahaemolyticus]ELA9840939.1 hypothetical protein [Vibrio parahaemolyticus]QIR97446.1 hypothetical protein FR741_06540 [Vibrio diabolicus]